MPTTRASARLARARPTKPKPVVEDVDPAPNSDAAKPESEYNESDDDEPQAPARKRPRTAKKVAKSTGRKRQVRGKQGRLAGLMNMPIDIFTEIASYLLPSDIIVLSRSSKFFRKLLMSKSSSHVWHSSMRNVKGLPPCPPDLSIPHYLALLFSKTCTICGGSAPRRMDEILHVRFCAPCRQENVMQFYKAPTDLLRLLNRSAHVVPSKRRYGCEPHVLCSEVEALSAKLQELQEAGDESDLEAWKAARRQEVDDRAEKAKALTQFLDDMDTERERELSVIKQERRVEIERRLLEIGWEKADMQFNYFSPSRRGWYTLVEQARPLTDRIWTNLRDKLTPLLEENRKERLEREKNSREQSRRERLIQLLNQIRTSAAPILQFSVLPPTIPPTSSAPPGNPNNVSYSGVFPDFTDALGWPVVKTLYQNDTDAAQFEAGFEKHRAEIDTHIAEWKVMVEGLLAGRLREGSKPDHTNRNILDPTLIVTQGGGDPFADVSDNLKSLLRADSFFHPTRIPTGVPLIFDAAVAGGYSYAPVPHSMKPHKQPLDVTRFSRYDEAQAAARILLRSIHKPDACYLEMRSVGQRYVCGRCHDTSLKTWEELVYHYVCEKRKWDTLQFELSALTKAGIKFNNVHDPLRLGDRPLMKYKSTAQLDVELASIHDGAANLKGCKLCFKSPIRQDVRGSESSILTHLREVHEVSNPNAREHYDNAFLMGLTGLELDFDMFHDDLYDDEFFEEGPLWGYDSDDEYLWGW